MEKVEFVFHGLIGAMFLFLVWRFILPLPLPSGGKAALALFFLALSQQHLVNNVFFGTLASPELPSGVLLVQGAMFGTLLLLAVFVLLRDCGTLLVGLVCKPKHPIAGSRLSAFGLFMLAASLSAAGAWQAVRAPDVRTVEIPLSNLPERADGFRMVHLTDVHASSLFQEERIRELVEKTNALNPDVILLSGDIVDGSPKNRAADIAPLRELQARYGVFACAGNHEYISNFSDWMQVFQDLGLRMLLNEHAIVTHNGVPLVIAGTTDTAALRFGLQPPDVNAALAGAPQETPIILMEHQPGNARDNAAAGVALQLSGHTHGGQIRGLRIVSQYVNNGFISGLYAVDGMRLYVGNGAGLWNGFPIRLGCPSEITEIVLRKPL